MASHWFWYSSDVRYWRLVISTAGLTACLWLMACGGPEISRDGPLEMNDTEAEWCLPRLVFPGEFSHGSEIILNTSETPVHVTDVRLEGADGVRLINAYAAPVRGTLVGTLIGWPPESGAELGPLTDIDGGAQINLVLEVASQTAAGPVGFDGLKIDYEQSGTDYSVASRVGVTWREHCG